MTEQERKISFLLGNADKKVGVIVMASGISKRFGENKLFAQLGGQTLLEIVCRKAESAMFADKLVLTRTPGAAEYCHGKDIPVVLHDLPDRNEAIRLGVEKLSGCDAILFLQCDQPLVSGDSIGRLVMSWIDNGFKGIHRLAFNGEPGSPVLFSEEYYRELKQLPAKKGGAYIARNHPDEVYLINAESALEMKDIDTKEDLEFIQKSI